MDKQYSTTWVQENEMPQIGAKCPKCSDGYLKDSQYGGVWCPKCRWKWRISKYPAKNGAEKENPKDVILMDELKAINERLDKLGAYLKGKLGE